MIESVHDWRWLLFALLAVAAASDIRALKIPNELSLAIVAAAAVALAANGAPPADFASAAISGLIGLAVGYALFAAGLMGGGDGKLFAAGATWFAPPALLAAGLFTSLAGVVLALAVFAARTLRNARGANPIGASARAAMKGPIPYGVAIAAGYFMATLNLAAG